LSGSIVIGQNEWGKAVGDAVGGTVIRIFGVLLKAYQNIWKNASFFCENDVK